MPRLRRIIAQGRGGVVRLPRPRFGTLARGFGELTKFGGGLSTIADKLQRTEDNLELAEKAGELDSRLKNLAFEVQRNPDFTSHPTLYAEGGQKIFADIVGRSKSNVVHNALSGHFNKTFPSQIVDVKANAIKLWHDDQIARFNAGEDTLSRVIAEGTPEEAAEAKRLHAGLLAQMKAGGHFDARTTQKREEKFREKTTHARMQVLRLTDRAELRRQDKKGLFRDADPKIRLDILKAADADQAREERQLKSAKVEERKQENNRFYDQLQDDKLDFQEVVDSTILTRQDKEFFKESLTHTDDIETDPRTAIAIEEILTGVAPTRTDRAANALQARSAAQRAFAVDKTLEKTDALNMIRRADDILAGEDVESQRWFKNARDFLKEKFGWQGGPLGRFVIPGGGERYWRLWSQLMREHRADPINMSGQRLFERAKEIAAPEAVDFFSEQAGLPAPPVEQQLPDPSQFKGRTMRDKQTGTRFKSDGKKWEPVGAPK